MRRYYKNVLRDQDGNVIPASEISVFLAGTATPANVYATLGGTVPVHKVDTDENGVVEFYVSSLDYGSAQKFKMTSDKDGFTSVTWDNVDVGSVVLGTYDVDDDVSVDHHLSIPEGVVLRPASGKTITIQSVSSGPYQVFDESEGGSVVVTEYPQDRKWWGEDQDLQVEKASVSGCSVVAASGSMSTDCLIMGTSAGEWVVKALAYLKNLVGVITHVTKTESGSLSEDECAGTCVDNYGQTEAMTLGLPAPASDGASFVFDAATSAATAVRFDPDGAEHIWLDGSDLGEGKYAGKDSVSEGDRIAFHRVKDSSGGYKWQATSINGTWVGE